MQKLYICSKGSDWRIALVYGDVYNRNVNSCILKTKATFYKQVDRGPISTEHAYVSSVTPFLER